MQLTDLTPADYNPRKITDDELDRLAASIREHTAALRGWDAARGWRLASTITVNHQGNRIVGGHQRLKALERLGQDWVHDEDITWVDLEPDSYAEKALNVALNSSDAAGSFDWQQLSAILTEAEEAGENLDLFALAPETLEPLLGADWSPPAANPDALNERHNRTMISFEPEQRAVIDKAIANLRAAKGEPNMPEGEALKLICEAWLEAAK